MRASELIGDPTQAATRVLELLGRVRKEGRRVLVVIGAGCSFSAGMPLMKEVYAYLGNRLDAGAHKQLAKLQEWLEVLKNEGGPRSLAAQALGLFQQPRLVKEGEAREKLQAIWSAFAIDFLMGNVAPDRKLAGPTILSAPATNMHERIAEWIRTRLAVVLSLNFDGLTRKAVEEASKKDGNDERCVILTKRKEIDQYFFGEQSSQNGDKSSPLWAVIKARGDVFHATCRNERCPTCHKPAAIYDLQIELPKQFSESEVAQSILSCPECGSPRHLEISFIGYQRKEDEAEDVLDGLRECVMHRIGGIITVGISGLWDDALVELFARTGRLWKEEDEAKVCRIICVDRKPENGDRRPFLVELLEGADIPILHAATGAEELAEALTDPSRHPIGQYAADRDFDVPFTKDMQIPWVRLVLNPCEAPEPLNSSGKLRDPTVSERFAKIRQLGLKTALVRAPKTDRNWEEKKHNRLVHSAGTAVIGLAWLKKLLAGKEDGQIIGAAQFPSSVLESSVFLACLTHDLSHLPFTHLTEDVFAELHWTTSPWGGAFHHDASVLDICEEKLREWANGTINEIHEALNLPRESCVLRTLVSRAIEGRSGIEALDAIVNSPIDADKIEYVFADSQWMKQDVHLPPADDELRLETWLKVFIEGQRVLPSGVIAISGQAADNAHQLLQERRWLYKNLYFRPAFRVVERIVHHLLVRWLTWHVGQRLAGELMNGSDSDFDRWSRDGGIDVVQNSFQRLGAIALGDTRCVKGRAAARLLWESLLALGDDAGEPKLAIEIANRLAERHRDTSLEDWYERCHRLLQQFLQDDPSRDYAEYEEMLGRQASWSSRMYARRSDLEITREIVRNLEYGSEPTALIDLAPLPPMLSYPTCRRFARGNRRLHADCWAVPHKDPERWGKETGRWVPLGKTALARHDRAQNRWVQILVVSPRPDDQPALQYLEDRFRSACDKDGIQIFDEEPPVLYDDRKTID